MSDEKQAKHDESKSVISQSVTENEASMIMPEIKGEEVETSLIDDISFEAEPVIDLASKQKLDSDFISKLEKMGKEAQEMINSGALEVDPEMMKNMEILLMASMKGEWDKFSKAVNSLDGTEEGMLDFSLFNAIVNDAPFNLINDLLNRGANLVPSIAPMLALKNNLPLMKKLVPYGLDLHGIDEQGKNALNHSLVHIGNKAMFDYLLVNNVSVKPSVRAVDPLDQALGHLQTQNDAIYYVDKLVSYGAPIEISHQQSQDIIKSKNPEGYFPLQEQIPGLFN